MEKLEAEIPDFFKRLTSNGWICFAPKPIRVNHKVVREFYANALRTDFRGEVFTIGRDKQVDFGPKIVNAPFGLPNANNEVYKARAKERGSHWFVERLHYRVILTWERLDKGVVSSEFTTKAKTWPSIICAKIMPSRHESEVASGKALMITTIVVDLPVNVGQHMVCEIEEACNRRSKSLFFPSMIT